MRTCLEGERAENVRGSGHPASPAKQNKGKEPIRSKDNDAEEDDELSSGRSPLSDLLPPKNNVEAESRKRPLQRSSRSVRGIFFIGYSENLAEKGGRRNTPLNTYPRGSEARRHHFPSHIRPSERHSSHLCPYLPLSGDLRTCCHPH